MNFLQKLFGTGKSSKPKTNMKRTPEIQAALDRIEARKQKELKENAEKQRRERLFKTRDQLANDIANSPKNTEEQMRQLKRKGERVHDDRLEADSGIMANSKLDLWLNTISPQDPPDTIAPQMRIPDTVFDIKTNKFKQ